MKKCYSYIRFSTSQQSQGDSHRRQLSASKQYALDNNLIFDETLTIQDLGVSAYKKDNVTKGALGEFIKAVENGTVERGSILLVESLDRISRADVMTALKYFISILEAGITIVTLQDNCEYSADSISDNWTQLIISITYMARAHEEIKTKTERISAAWKQKANTLDEGKIWTSLVPMWLTVKNDKIEMLEHRVATIRDIFDMYCGGKGHLLISKNLNEQNIPSFKGKKWGKSAIKKILNNRAVMGYLTPKMKGEIFEEIPNYYPSIIDENVFYKAKQLAKNRIIGGQKTTNSKLNSLLSGIAFCFHCGKAMTFVSMGKKHVNTTHPDLSNRLICNSHRSGKGCYRNSVLYNYFELNILTMLHEIDMSEIFNDNVEDNSKQILEGKLLEQKNSLKKYEELIDGEDTIPKMVLGKIQKVEDTISELQSEIEKSKIPTIINPLYVDNPITDLQLATSTLAENEVYELRLKTRQSIQQMVSKITIHSHKSPEPLEPDCPEYMEYYEETKKIIQPPQYFVHFKSGNIRHIAMVHDSPTKYLLTKDRDQIT